MIKVLVIGGGSWGLSIASLISQNINKPNSIISSLTIYSRKKLGEEKILAIKNLSGNKTNQINFINQFSDFKSNYLFDLAFIAIPLSSFEDFFAKNIEFCNTNIKNFVICSKGYLSLSLQSSFDYLTELFAKKEICILSGPNFANEILHKYPTVTTIASKSADLLNTVNNVLENDFFTTQKTSDVNGVCALGLCKNAIAIGYGLICNYKDDQINLQSSTNAKAMFLSLIYNETYNFLPALKADQSTINLSCGIGDIFLSCSDTKSRNVSFGIKFAEYSADKSLLIADIILKAKNNQTVEGIESINIINALCKKHKLNLPIYQNIFNLLYGYINFDNFIQKTLYPNLS
jgi:glycerol-3-phosphate dehydrogenase (NAD(P)+)